MRIKRFIDIVTALIALLLLWPIFLLLALVIKMDSSGPILFKQKRIGIHKNSFYILKFRTMRLETPKDMPTHLFSTSGTYITKSGYFLRKTSLDELPQILNILKGEMSIIGPRPALWNQDNLITEREKYKANDVSPGLTGWAQINGRDELTIEMKAKLDGEYVQRQGLFFDSVIFFKTILYVVKADGIKIKKPLNIKAKK